MSPFRFALERLLRLRALREQEQARALGDALRDEAERRTALESARAGLDRAGEQAGRPPAAAQPAGAVRNLRLTVQAAALAAESAEESHRDAVESLERQQERFGEARRDRRVLEKLRERRHEDWSEDRARAEQKESDSLTDARRQARREDV